MDEAFDVVVAGGGPGGSVTAARLAKSGRHVLLLERDDFPRFHLGESLLPDSVAVLQAVGLSEEVDRRYLRKLGAVFHDTYTPRVARFDFSEAFTPKSNFAYQVPRDDFDTLLLEHARSLGVTVRHRWSAKTVRFDGDRAVGVTAEASDGALFSIDARFVVDATGRDALMAHARRGAERLDGLETTALFSQWRGAAREQGDFEGDFHLVLLGDTLGDPASAPLLGWFWFIPFKDGRTSVGVAASRTWIRRHAGKNPQQLYLQALEETPAAAERLRGAEQLWDARAMADFSFHVRELFGNGWVAVGDAGGFIDPLFSTGAHLAMYGGFHAAGLIDQALTDGDVSKERFSRWEATMRSGAGIFTNMVRSFYDGVLSRLIFAERPHPYLKRVITSLLAGNVFEDEARWALDAKNRMSPPALRQILASSR